MARVHGRRDVAGERPRAERADIYHELADIRTDRHDIFLDKYGAPAESRLCADEPRHLPDYRPLPGANSTVPAPVMGQNYRGPNGFLP